MKKLISYMKGLELIYLGVFLILAYIQIYMTMKIPEYMTDITNLMQQNESNIITLIPYAAKMLFFSIAAILCAAVSVYCLAYTSSTIVMRLRKELFEKLMSFNLTEIKKFSTSSLITRCTNDVEQVRLFISVGVQAIVQCPLTLIMAVSKMQGNSVWMTAIIITAVLLVVVTILLISLSLNKMTKVQKLIDDVNRLTKEHITGMRVIHAYNGYEFQRGQFEAVNDTLTKTNISANRYVGAISPFFNFCLNGLTLVIYVLGSYMIYGLEDIAEKQQIFSQMVVFSSYALQAFAAFGMIIIVIAALPRVVISLKRITEVIDTDIEITDGMATGGANGKFGSIEFRNVSFTYPGAAEKALSDISFTLEKGQTLAIIGSTGAGKTTIMNLIMRFYDVTEGAVFVDGRDVRDYNLWALRDKIGYVPQKSFLFAGTIGSNINYGNKSGLENTIEEIRHAAEIGQSKDFIEKKNGKYDARVEEGGSNFSGGQKQRLTISRAVCRDPEFYLFDDSFSALDFKTDSILRKKLRESAKNSTQVIVGQRVGSIMNADIILVVDKGRIVGKGKHEELLESCSVYREIAMSQLASEEVK